ncbi:hypothetical protein N752_31285 [Desulforamulus aquiferis]|nr:diguanylate cyclase [Desulforamulus aquiferis]RYD01237.1 hypothetical protein N752_31285 [Desulforamulus aquiferis]
MVKIADIMELKLKRVSQRLEEISNIDYLTNLANRRYFHKVLENEWYRAVRNNSSLALIMIDIDFFKSYNDIYGHVGGDKCLERLASVFNNTLKRTTDLVARYGGEEFVILLPGTNLSGARDIARTLNERVSSLELPHSGSTINGKITMSIGMTAKIPDLEVLPESLILEADEALYCAKARGRNCIIEYKTNDKLLLK